MKLVEHKSLDRVDTGIGYVQKFLAIISGLLLLLGLVSATWNTLTDDWLFQTLPWIQHSWAGDQALAVDANLSLVFIYLFTALRDKEWVKVGVYSAIGGALLFVAAVVMNIESVRQALGVNLPTATHLVGVDLLLLTRIRSYVIVGLVAMSGAATIDLFRKPAKADTTSSTSLNGTVPVAPAPETVSQPTTSKRKPRTDQNGNSNLHRYQAYMQLNPNASAKQAATSLKISLTTVARYRSKEKKEAVYDGSERLVQLSATN
jgi:signal transduction histidine kinase